MATPLGTYVVPKPVIVKQRTVGSITVLELGERLTVEGVAELRDRLDRLMEEGHLDLLVDCGRVMAIDSPGVGALVRNWVSLSQRGGKLKLLHPSDRVRDVLQVTGLAKVIDSFDDIADALRSF